MRRLILLLATAVAAVASLPGAAHAAKRRGPRARTAQAQRALGTALTRAVHRAGGVDGAYVVDLDTGQPLFSYNARAGRLPASVEKIYTTSTALLRFGQDATLRTGVLGVGQMDASGGWHGTLYLRGGGDPTFGSASFDRAAYGTGATMQRLVANLLRATGIKSLHGSIVGDESYFDSVRGTAAYGFRPDFYYEGLLTGLAYDRGFTTPAETAFQSRPALFAAQQFAAALKAAGVKMPAGTPVYTGRTPAGARSLATVKSPSMARLIQLTNTPSDNYLAEMLLKGIGARFGGAGSTAAGAGVVRSFVAGAFGIHPRLDDGSGLSYSDSTSPFEVVAALSHMAGDSAFVDSLAVGGETGTLQDEMRGTAAQGRCRGKTGTLAAVANLAGYCAAQDGHTLAFAFLMNRVGNTATAHAIEANMAVAVARYKG